jgi:hypothetical protein
MFRTYIGCLSQSRTPRAHASCCVGRKRWQIPFARLWQSRGLPQKIASRTFSGLRTLSGALEQHASPVMATHSLHQFGALSHGCMTTVDVSAMLYALGHLNWLYQPGVEMQCSDSHPVCRYFIAACTRCCVSCRFLPLCKHELPYSTSATHMK